MKRTAKAATHSEHPKGTPWERPNPRPPGQRTRLSAEAREKARARAEEAGRPYPNLVDNMWAARLMKRGR